MGGVHRAVVLAGPLLAIAVLCAGVASADGPVQLKSRLGNWCLDAPSGNFNTATVINPCNGSQSQLWNFDIPGRIQSVAFPGSCLTIGEVNEWLVTIVPCQMGGLQHWSMQPDGHITNGILQCIDVINGVANPGALVIGLNCAIGGPGAEWDSVP
ncbi:ricin-type beta-trefoil lectin domain protein [Mycobacterium decipiens]